MPNPPRSSTSRSTARAQNTGPPQLTPTTNSPTHVVVPRAPSDRNSEAGPSSSGTVRLLSRSDPASPPPRGEFSFSEEDSLPITAEESSNMDDLWGMLRQQKGVKMSKEQVKVKSLEQHSRTAGQIDSQHAFQASHRDTAQDRQTQREPSQRSHRERQRDQNEEATVVQSPAASPTQQPTKSLKRVRSLTSFRESDDGRTLIVFFDVTNVLRENVHVSFKPPRVIISWFIQTITETEDEEGRIIIERLQKDYQRTLPLPRETKYEEIRGAFNGHHLVLRVPNYRAYRVDRVWDDREDDAYQFVDE
ncbi:hypothetical protein CYLTODRAFT_408042 [Cylindrobasidium torrendii FP15055 ss-10]|uniref:SHSP domain-containing protein n=1 Tax=Cylindrobasidium torrendii FP15055 ss-10 TaxID=1314674 RepID=A0A0D7BMV9_9AGAR|nr:hypothetical protein CYLTODRAFT_408042 [Cylindrobasidium torrendii FP15055 ss-10]